MAAETVKGLDAFILTSQSRGWTKENGLTITQRWQGPQARIADMEATLKRNGASKVDSDTGVPGEISATFSGSIGGVDQSAVASSDQESETNAVWELFGEIVERRLETHGKFIASQASAGILLAIEQAIKDGTAADTDWDSVYVSTAEYNAYRDLRLLGVDSYQACVYRLRRTVTATLDTIIKPSFANPPGKVVTWATATAKMIGAKFDQPKIHYCSPYASGLWTDDSVDEWLVQPPVVSFDRKARKWIFTEEWVGSLQISGTLYDGGTGTP